MYHGLLYYIPETSWRLNKILKRAQPHFHLIPCDDKTWYLRYSSRRQGSKRNQSWNFYLRDEWNATDYFRRLFLGMVIQGRKMGITSNISSFIMCKSLLETTKYVILIFIKLVLNDENLLEGRFWLNNYEHKPCHRQHEHIICPEPPILRIYKC